MGVKDVLGRKNSKQNGSKIRPCLMPLYKRKKQCDWNWMNEEKVVRNEVRELMVYSLTQVTIKMLAFTGRFSHLSPFFFFFFPQGWLSGGLCYWNNELNIYWFEEDTKTDLYGGTSKLDFGQVKWWLVNISEEILMGNLNIGFWISGLEI